MKAPKYIVRNQEFQEYAFHIKRLDQIKNKQSDWQQKLKKPKQKLRANTIQGNEGSQDLQILKIEKSVEYNIQTEENQDINQYERINSSLEKQDKKQEKKDANQKALDIEKNRNSMQIGGNDILNYQRYSILSTTMMKSLNMNDVEQENLKLASKLITLNSNYEKAKQEKEYEKHQQYLKQLKKFHEVPTNQNSQQKIKQRSSSNYFVSQGNVKIMGYQTKYYNQFEMAMINQGDLNMKIEIIKFHINNFSSQPDTQYYLELKQKRDIPKKIYLDQVIEEIKNFRFQIGVKIRKINKNRIKFRIYQNKINNQQNLIGIFFIDLNPMITNKKCRFEDSQDIVQDFRNVGKLQLRVEINPEQLENLIQYQTKKNNHFDEESNENHNISLNNSLSKQNNNIKIEEKLVKIDNE